MTAGCAAAAAVAAAVNAISAGAPRARNEFSRSKPSAENKTLDPKSICNQPSKQQPCPPFSRPGAGAGAGTGVDTGAGAGTGVDTDAGAASDAGSRAGSGVGSGAVSGAGSGAGTGVGSGACVDAPVLNIKALISIDMNPTCPGPTSQQESAGFQGRGPRSQESTGSHGPRPQESAGSHGPMPQESAGSHGPRPQESAGSHEPMPQESAGFHGPMPQESAGSHGPRPQESAGSHGPMPQESSPPSQQESAVSQKRLPQSQNRGPQFQASKTVGQDDSPKAKNRFSQVLAVERGEMSRQDKRPHTVGDTRPWYCNSPNFHETALPKTPLSRAPPNAPFFHSAARFSSDPRFKAPAPNTYLPPVMSKVRWSGILTGYHGIPTCYNVVDRNCDLSTVHMHCVMCPPRGVYSKSIGQPLHELYPDDKQRAEQLRHMCTWHAGEVKRAYHERGMFTRGCTDGVEGRSDIGPSGFRSENIGCSCTRRDNLGGAIDDATLEKMAEALNRKRRDADTFTPSAVCLKFAEKAASTDEADKLKRDRAEECTRKCAEYRKMIKEGDETTGEPRQMQRAVFKQYQGSGKDALRGPVMKPPGMTESRPSRIGEPVECRLASVTESCEEAQMQWNDEDATAKSPGRVSKKSSGVLSKKSSAGVSSKTSEVSTKKSSGAVSRTSRVGSGRSSAFSEKSSGVMSGECEEPGAEGPEGADILSQQNQEGNRFVDTGSECLPSGTPSRASEASPVPASADNCSTGTGRQSVVTYAEDGVNVGINAQDPKRQSVGTNAQDGKSVTGPCPPITFECNCALYKKNAENMPFPPAPQGSGSQYGEQQSCGQQYGIQAQYAAPYAAQQYGASSQQYGARVKLCFAPNGQTAGTNTQQYGPQGQQDKTQGQQDETQGQQYVPQGQQYVPQCQQYAPQGQQYGAQCQQYRPDQQSQHSEQQQTRSDCSSCAPCFASMQLSQDGTSGTSASTKKVCISPSKMPFCPSNDPSQGSNTQ